MSAHTDDDREERPSSGLEDAETAAEEASDDEAAATIRGDVGTGTAPEDVPEDDPDREGAERYDAG